MLAEAFWEKRIVQGDSLARGPKLVYLQIFNEFVNQLTDDELTIFEDVTLFWNETLLYIIQIQYFLFFIAHLMYNAHLVPVIQEAGWAPGPVWTGAENLAPTGIRSPVHPACSQSLYRLSYPAHSHPCTHKYRVWMTGIQNKKLVS
jgi:hypothetical protein